MTLPEKRRQYWPSLRKARLEDAPWYEILFWQTWFRFQCPPPTWRYPKDCEHLYEVDERPFVNSESRQRYTSGENPLYQSMIAFTTGWKLGPRSLFSRRSTYLKLQLIGLGVSQNAQTEFPNLFDPAIAHRWLIKVYRMKHATLGQLGFLPAQNGFSEIAFTDKATAKAMADAKTYSINTVRINAHLAYECQPFANYLDYFVPFGPLDALQFGFSIQANGAAEATATATATAAILEDAKARVNAILASLELESTQPLSQLQAEGEPAACERSLSLKLE